MLSCMHCKCGCSNIHLACLLQLHLQLRKARECVTHIRPDHAQSCCVWCKVVELAKGCSATAILQARCDASVTPFPILRTFHTPVVQPAACTSSLHPPGFRVCQRVSEIVLRVMSLRIMHIMMRKLQHKVGEEDAWSCAELGARQFNCDVTAKRTMSGCAGMYAVYCLAASCILFGWIDDAFDKDVCMYLRDMCQRKVQTPLLKPHDTRRYLFAMFNASKMLFEI
jgi:hypothetical protein